MAINAPPGSIRNALMMSSYDARISNDLSLNFIQSKLPMKRKHTNCVRTKKKITFLFWWTIAWFWCIIARFWWSIAWFSRFIFRNWQLLFTFHRPLFFAQKFINENKNWVPRINMSVICQVVSIWYGGFHRNNWGPFGKIKGSRSFFRNIVVFCWCKIRFCHRIVVFWRRNIRFNYRTISKMLIVKWIWCIDHQFGVFTQGFKNSSRGFLLRQSK